KYSRVDRLSRAEQRLRMIAFDVSEHYKRNWQRDGYYKAQLVAPDKKSAIRLHRFFREIGDVSTRVVISPPEEKEGEDYLEDANDGSVSRFWKEEVENGSSAEKYEEDTIADFNSGEPPEILIVVDKLLTGFDVPRNTVLYLARRLTSHSLLQAIARVNRLYPGKDFGYIIDYMGILGELDKALTDYRALEGYEEDDLRALLMPVQEKYQELPQRHGDLLGIFAPLGSPYDNEEAELLLRDEPLRESFYDALRVFSKTLKVALSTEAFYEETPAHVIARYQGDLTRFQKLRGSVQTRYADVVDIRQFDPQIAKLLDQHVSSDSVTVLTPEPINIFDTEAMDIALNRMGTDGARADAIASQMERTLTERMDEDPALYRKFSEMLRAAIQEFRDRMISGVQYLTRVTAIREEFVAGRPKDDLPERVAANDVAAAYYRLLQEYKESLLLPSDEPETIADFVLAVDAAIRQEIVVDWHKKQDVLNTMRANVDDVFFDFSTRGVLALDWAVLDKLAAEIFRVAGSRLG
ncbi:MAG: type I restriction endonuclease subunit R, partial [Fibrella sp.]|nr:type I restriction endonuclease subunit R [Armatimonadota bacterium]